MIIDFTKLEEWKLNNFKGGENYVLMHKFLDERNLIVRISIPKGGSIGFHKHEIDQEVMYIISGEGILIENGSETKVYKGNSTYCPQGKEHSIKNLQDENLEIFAVITKF